MIDNLFHPIRLKRVCLLPKQYVERNQASYWPLCFRRSPNSLISIELLLPWSFSLAHTRFLSLLCPLQLSLFRRSSPSRPLSASSVATMPSPPSTKPAHLSYSSAAFSGNVECSELLCSPFNSLRVGQSIREGMPRHEILPFCAQIVFRLRMYA